MTRVTERGPDSLSVADVHDVDRAGEPSVPASAPVQLDRARVLTGGLLAVVALIAAVVYAIGPAIPERSVYSWSVDAAAGPPAFTPLELTAPTPETLSVSLPCAASAADWMEFETDNVNTGLAVSIADRELVVASAGQSIASTPWGSGSACPGVFSVNGAEWTLTAEAGELLDSGTIDPITVSRLAVAGSGAPASGISAEVVTKAYGSEPSKQQIITFLIAAIAAAAALLLLGTAARSGRRVVVGTVSLRLGWADAFVVFVIAIWAVLGPVLFDDGWFLANQRAFSESGTITDIYWATSSNYPLGYWYQWMWHFWTDQFEAPIYLRLVAVGMIIATWSVVRVSLNLVSRPDRGAAWRNIVSTLVFLVGSMAWLMTLRPEPLIAVLATATLASCLAFRKAPSIRSLAIGAVFAAVALSAHPAGIVAVAPLCVILPSMLRWLGKDGVRWTAFASIAVACSAVIALLAVVDSDLSLKVEASNAMSETGATFGLLGEWARYVLLIVDGRTSIRFLAVGVSAVAVVSILSQRSRWKSLDAVPTWSVLLSFVLLALLPTKWLWHFGALVGYLAVAVGIEVGSWRRPLTRESTVLLTPVAIMMGAVVVAAALAAGSWNLIDLRSLDWKGVSEGARLAILATAAVGVAIGSFMWVRRRGLPLRQVVTVAMASMLVVASAGAIATTIGVFAADAIVTDGWTFGSQNVRALAFDADCGVADEITLPRPGSGGQPTSLSRIVGDGPVLEVFVHPDIALYLPCVRQRSRDAGVWPVADIFIMPSERAGLEPDARSQNYQQYDRYPFKVLLGESYYSGEAPGYGAILTRG